MASHPAWDERPTTIGLGTAVIVAVSREEGVVTAVVPPGAPPAGFPRGAWAPVERYVVQSGRRTRRLLRRSELIVVSR